MLHFSYSISSQRASALVTLMMEAKRTSETPVITRATRCNIQEDGILRMQGSLLCISSTDRFLAKIAEDRNL
jgi:hypothetical protein